MADAGPQDTPRHAGQGVPRVLLRRNIAIDAETAQAVAAVQPDPLPRLPRQKPRAPAASCEPLF